MALLGAKGGTLPVLEGFRALGPGNCHQSDTLSMEQQVMRPFHMTGDNAAESSCSLNNQLG
jgi:hypothetical protein